MLEIFEKIMALIVKIIRLIKYAPWYFKSSPLILIKVTMTFKKLMSDWYWKCHHGSQKVAYLQKSVSRVFKKAILISKRVTAILKRVTNLDQKVSANLQKASPLSKPLKSPFYHNTRQNRPMIKLTCFDHFYQKSTKQSLSLRYHCTWVSW